ncbi:MAG TPA: amidohydrolase [Gemmatimonadales bacterium]|nr:amidohydrolase [Gemmatimonadales bacterium]
MRRAFSVVALTLLGACGSKADVVIQGGTVWTGLSTGRGQRGAVAMRGDKILAVGDSAEIARYIGPKTWVAEADGGLIMPGFADGHTHFINGGFQLASVDLRNAATPQEFVRRLKEYASHLQPGDWITGGDWDHTLWRGTPLPQHGWIDSVTPNNPVFVNRLDGHMALANSAAMRAAGVTPSTPAPFGGEITRGGVFKDQAMGLIGRAVREPSPEQRDSALARALSHAASLGVTATSHVSASWADLASYRRLARANLLTIRVILYFPIEDWRAVAESVSRGRGGDDWIRLRGVKGFMDGSAGSRTAYFFDPFSDSAGYRGMMLQPESDMRAWIGGADSAGLQVAVHAIGDRANATLLAIFDSVARAHDPRDRRFRIEHAQHLRAEDIPKFGARRVVASMQPYHAIDDGRWLLVRIGPERIKTTYAFRTLIHADAPLAFGSDWTVAPLDPMQGVYAAVTRRTLDDRNPGGWVPEQEIGVGEALRAYTYGNAWATFNEQKWGTLAAGRLADVVVLERDPFAVAPESLGTIKPRFTFVGGRVVYQKAL